MKTKSPVKLKFAHFQLPIDALIITVLEIIPDSFEFVRLNGMKQKNLPLRASYHVKTTSILDPNIQNYSDESTAEFRASICFVLSGRGRGRGNKKKCPKWSQSSQHQQYYQQAMQRNQNDKLALTKLLKLVHRWSCPPDHLWNWMTQKAATNRCPPQFAHKHTNKTVWHGWERREWRTKKGRKRGETADKRWTANFDRRLSIRWRLLLSVNAGLWKLWGWMDGGEHQMRKLLSSHPPSAE